MEKNEVWENIKKYAKVFFQGVGLFFAYVFHYIAVFAKFVYKHLKKLFKKLFLNVASCACGKLLTAAQVSVGHNAKWEIVFCRHYLVGIV